LVSICETLIKKVKGDQEVPKIELPSDFQITSIIDNLTKERELNNVPIWVDKKWYRK